jgi:hypothetical protein
VLDAQISSNHKDVDILLNNLKEIYGADYLKGLTDVELYDLFKRHSFAK